MQKIENKSKGQGLTGLSNLGNTCFINSCIQILSHTKELNDLLDKQVYKKRLNNKYESALLIEWDNLRTLMWSQDCIISPGKFIKTIQKLAQIKGVDIFTGFAQNDLPEFLLFVIDCFHISLQREVTMKIVGEVENEKDKLAASCFEMIQKMYSKEYSEIWNMFYAVHASQIVSLKTGTSLSVTPEPFFIINLSIPQNNKSPSLEDCFDHYVEGELLEGDNAWFNEETGQKENVRKQIQFWSFPSILVIDLKRFNSRNVKNQILVTFPLENLDLSKYVIGYNKKKFVYDLYGICNHSGGAHGGHYTSFVKIEDGRWFHFNDTDVKEVKDLNHLISPKAYCFFYRIISSL
jgi:ubiquitin C-terminal hydrolase